MPRLQPLATLLGSSLASFYLPALASDVPVVSAALSTLPLHRYEDAPAAPHADDPAIGFIPVIRANRW